MFERARNDAMPFSFLLPSPCPLLPALPFLRTSYDPACWVGECAGGCDDCVACVVAWLLVHGQVADVVSSVSSRRYRLVGRGEERTVFVLGSVLAICRLVLVLVLVLVVPSRRRGSYPWRLASMSCPSCLILFACYHYLVSSCVSFLISSGVSLCLPCPRCVFLVFFRLVRWRSVPA